MRTNLFNETVIDSPADDVGLVFVEREIDPNDCYAIIYEDEDISMFYFDILSNEDGDQIATSDPIFHDVAEAKFYLRGRGLNSIQVN